MASYPQGGSWGPPSGGTWEGVGDGDGYGGGEQYDMYGRRRQVFDGKQMRKPVVRKTVDFNCTIAKHFHNRIFQRDERDRGGLEPTLDYVKDLESAGAYRDNPSTAFCTKYVSTAINKVRCPINACSWTPEGRRLITASHSGEFTLWNGLTFNFETILQAHENPVRCMLWSHSDEWMVTCDDAGVVKYWQSSMNNVKAFQAHKDPIRDISFCPTDAKFATGSDDSTIKIWDFSRVVEETKLIGHGWDVKTVSWHPQKSLIVSGSKDSLIKLWDPKTSKCLATLHGHKNTVSKVRWNKNGLWFMTAARDQLIKLWDVRMLGPGKEFQTCRGHTRDVTSIAWHPQHERLFVSGSFEGTILYWLTDHEEPQAEICGAHDNSIWDLSWHPLGHILTSGSSDHTTRFWTRNRPGDDMKDKYNANQLPQQDKEEALLALAEAAKNNPGRHGRMPAVLANFDPSVHYGEEEAPEPEYIPGIGFAVDTPQDAPVVVKKEPSGVTKSSAAVAFITASLKSSADQNNNPVNVNGGGRMDVIETSNKASFNKSSSTTQQASATTTSGPVHGPPPRASSRVGPPPRGPPSSAGGPSGRPYQPLPLPALPPPHSLPPPLPHHLRGPPPPLDAYGRPLPLPPPTPAQLARMGIPLGSSGSGPPLPWPPMPPPPPPGRGR